MITSEEAKVIADTTAKYLGGYGRLTAMLGANNFSYDKDGTLNFRFKMCSKSNHVSFKLNGKDLYDVKFSKIWGTSFKTVAEFNDLYFDSLRNVFEKFTGLYLSM